MKYGVVSLMFLAGNEIVSYLALSIMTVLFLCDILAERKGYRG